MRRPRNPPLMDFFRPERPEAGPHAVALDLSPLQLQVTGLDDELAELLTGRFEPYASRSLELRPDALRVRLARERTDYFIDPQRPEPVQVRIACDGDRVRYCSYRVAGWFDTVGGLGELLLAEGQIELTQSALENYIRAAVAWQAACRGGVLLHAASAVWNGNAYLFYGESGAGKSTLSECNRRARVVSDDLSLVLPAADGRLELIGSPFRGTYRGGRPVVGRFPVRAGFRLIQAERAEVRPVPRIQALAELVGNLPFVAEAFAARPELFERVQHGFADLPLAHLCFRKDDSYWDAIRAAGY